MFRKSREKERPERANEMAGDTLQAVSLFGQVGETDTYRQLHKMRQEIRELREIIVMLIEAQGFELHQSEFVPARESKLEIRKKPK